MSRKSVSFGNAVVSKTFKKAIPLTQSRFVRPSVIIEEAYEEENTIISPGELCW